MDIKDKQKIVDSAPIGATHYAVIRNSSEATAYVAYEGGIYWITPRVIPASINIMTWKVFSLDEMKNEIFN